jgi:hypothetical protein
MLFLPAYGGAPIPAVKASPPGDALHDYNFFEYSIDWGIWQ